MIFLVLSLASAADLEIAAEVGTAPASSPSQVRFGSGDSMPTIGGRAGLALTDALTVQLAAHHGRRGATWFGPDNQAIGAAAFYATDIALGLEAVAPVNEYFAVGGVGSATGQFSLARFDDDPDNRNSLIQKSANAFSPGFRLAPAVRISIPESAIPIPIQLRASLGYQWTTPIDLSDFGSTATRGMSLRVSLGVQL